MIQARKRFGQNFLHDRYVIQKIMEAIRPDTREHLIEIGPGQGALTFPLMERAPQLTAIEIDRDLIAHLREDARVAGNERFRLIEGDALKIDFSQLRDPSSSQKLTIVGNLPYNISTPLLFHLFSFRGDIDEMFFMLQKEVVLRMAAAPGNKDYGRLSVMTQYFCEVEPLFEVASGAFTPAPKVDSMIVHLRPYSTSPYGPVPDFARFETLVRLAFNQRRKTLRNALKTVQLNLPPLLAVKRAEELSIADFVSL